MANNIDMEIWQDDKQIVDITVETGEFTPGDINYGETISGDGTATNPINVSSVITGQISQNASAIAAESARAQSAEAEVAANVTTLSENIAENYATKAELSAESTTRTVADNNLQSQIDAINAASDVTDVVGTYAELLAYNTSALPDKSIIKVLQDESRNDETTYYRWVITDRVGTWQLIGEEGPYYTKSQTDELLQNKQNTMTAGTGIAISGDTINVAAPTLINQSSRYNALVIRGENTPVDYGDGSVVIGRLGTFTSDYSVAIGAWTKCDGYTQNITIGNGASIYPFNGTNPSYAIVLGNGSVTCNYAIQFGSGTNATQGTLKINNAYSDIPTTQTNYELLDNTGQIPLNRLNNVVWQFDTIPGSLINETRIGQYIGETTSELTKGCFYEVTGRTFTLTVPDGKIFNINWQKFYESCTLEERQILETATSCTLDNSGGSGLSGVGFNFDTGTIRRIYGGTSPNTQTSGIDMGLQVPGQSTLTITPASVRRIDVQPVAADGTIPAARHAALPTTDGTYVLKLVITDGVPTLSWVAE